MKKLPLLLLLGVCVAGCERKGEDGQSGERPASEGQGLLSREDARQLLWTLPEVTAWSNRVRRESRGKYMPIYNVERTPDDCRKAGDKRLVWIFCLEKQSSKEKVLWNRFQVDAASREIGVWDPFRGQYIPLAEWRQKHDFGRGPAGAGK